MSKSSPSTVTTVNPIAQAQLPFLQGEWQQGQNLAGLNGGTPAGQQYLSMLQDTAQINATNFLANGNGYNIMPQAGNALSGMFAGNYNNYAASPQAGYLSGLAPYAAQAVGGFANAAANAAYGLPSTVAPSVDALNSVGMTGMGLLPSGYQSYNTLSGLGGNAVSDLTGLGYQGIGALTGAGNQAFGTLAPVGQSAINYATGLAPGALAAANPAIAGLYGNAAGAISGNPFTGSLQSLASGQYIDPSRNPALPGMIQTATQPLVNQYMTATAPGLTGNAEAAGRYGSGALQNQQTIAGYGLGQALQGAISNIVNNAYNTGLGTTLGAGQAGGGIYNTGVANTTGALGQAGGLAQGGYQLAGNIGNQGYATGGNILQGANQDLINALGAAYGTGGGLVGSGYSTGGNLYGQGASALSNIAGTGLGAANTGYQAGGALNLNALAQAMQGLTGAGTLANQGYSTAGNMASQAGQLNNSGQLTMGSLVQNAPDIANYPLGAMSAAFNAGWAPLNNYAGILGGPQGGSSSVTSPNQQNILQSLGSGLGGIASFANLFSGAGPLAGIFGGSDRRLKTDIQRIGTADNGVPLYAFRYIGDDRITLGAMADEVEKVRPEAVITSLLGFKAVNYALALR